MGCKQALPAAELKADHFHLLFLAQGMLSVAGWGRGPPSPHPTTLPPARCDALLPANCWGAVSVRYSKSQGSAFDFFFLACRLSQPTSFAPCSKRSCIDFGRTTPEVDQRKSRTSPCSHRRWKCKCLPTGCWLPVPFGLRILCVLYFCVVITSLVPNGYKAVLGRAWWMMLCC